MRLLVPCILFGLLSACSGASERAPATEATTAAPALETEPPPEAGEQSTLSEALADEVEELGEADRAAAVAELRRLPPLGQARRGFRTQLRFEPGPGTPPEAPPRDVFELVRYPAPLGPSPAYVSVLPASARNTKKAAIVWIIGGFDFGISSYAWEPQPRENDQTAAAFREAGMVLMLPALRGFSGAPGRPECFLGEVGDILAAGRYLASRPEVDPARVYLGGHSTGGTLAMLASESQLEAGPFKAVFAFGPVDDPRGYGGMCPPADLPDESYETLLRAPFVWAANLGAPTWIVEGESGNADALELLRQVAGRAPLRTTIVPGAGHFDVLRPASELLARQLLAGTPEDPLAAVDLSESAILAAMQASR